MPFRFLFLSLFAFVFFGSDSQAQSPLGDTSAQKLAKAEQSLSAGAKARIAAVRSANTVRCGFLDSKGILWFGTNEGVYRYDGDSFKNLSTSDGLNNNQVFSIMEDKDGVLWFGTANGLCRYDRKTFVHVPIPWSNISGPWLDRVYPIVNPNQVTSMLQDRGGAIWLGTNGAGAYRYDGESFTSYLSSEGSTDENGLHNNIITSILEDTAGNIWFTSINHGGVSRFDGEVFTHYSMKDGLSDDMIRASFQDREGKIWFGTHGKFGTSGKGSGGLDFFDGKSFTQSAQNDGLLKGHVVSIYEDRSGHLWLGCGVGAVCIYDGVKFAPFVTKDGQTFAGVFFFMEDAVGNIWFGGSKGKLLRWDGESVTDFSLKGA
jgi:ligand-binding sensor domain-containing protein